MSCFVLSDDYGCTEALWLWKWLYTMSCLVQEPEANVNIINNYIQITHKSAYLKTYLKKVDWIIGRTITLNNCQPEKKQAPLDENWSAWHFYAPTFTIIHFHFLVKPTSKQVGQSAQWKLAHLTFSDLLIPLLTTCDMFLGSKWPWLGLASNKL